MGYSIEQFRSERGCLSYIMSDSATGEALIIDPSEEIRLEAYVGYLRKNGLSLSYIIETHTHADHVSSATALKAQTEARILQHHKAPSKRKDAALSEEQLQLGETTVAVMYTPGHTDDSVCLYVPGAVFTGDTLLIGGTGRTDFQNGSSEALYRSIHEKLMALPADTTVYPAHSYQETTSSTIGDERQNNPRVLLTKEAFISTMDAHHPPEPDLFKRAIAENSK